MTHTYKKLFPYAKIFYVVGLPRSGKSSLLYKLSSTPNCFFLDEPFGLYSLATKIERWDLNDPMCDLYLSNMDNLIIEQVLGRSFNYRKIDQSYIFNIKNKQQISLAQKIKGARDAVIYGQENPLKIYISFNFCDEFIHLVSVDPRASVVFVDSDSNLIKDAIKKKGWLEDIQLSEVQNISPIGYDFLDKETGRLFYIPYVIPPEYVEDFMGLTVEKRVSFYVNELETRLKVRLASIEHKKVLGVGFGQKKI